MADTEDPRAAAHLLRPPDADLWTAKLFFGRFQELAGLMGSLEEAQAALDERYKNGPARAVAREVIERSGGGLNPTANLALVGAFTEMKNSDAIEAVALARLGQMVVSKHRTNAGIRRHALMALLFECSPEAMIDVYLWDRHCSRRRPRFRLADHETGPTGIAPEDWLAAANAVIAEPRAQGETGYDTYDEAMIVMGSIQDEVLVAVREWPGRSTGRSHAGAVLTVRTPEWTCLHFSKQGRHVEISDAQANRGPDFASNLASRLVGEHRRYDLVVEGLSDDKLDLFLAMATDPANREFPLVEIVATLPWRPHRVMTVTGSRTSTAEEVVQDLQTLHHPFARDWHTVRSIKVGFESRYTIQVQFPRRGDPTAISYSDEGRSQPVSLRFAELLKKHLHVDVTSKARRGTRLPKVDPRHAPRRLSDKWWKAVLAPSTDDPEEWLDEAVAELVAQGLVRIERVRWFPCNSPHVNRSANPVDSLNCDGEVVLPWDLVEREDPHQLEDDSEIECSTEGHRWRPVRFGLPSRPRLLVEVDHAVALGRLREELERYGNVIAAPGRPGVLMLHLDDMITALVYIPLVVDAKELLQNTHGSSTPVAWVSGPGASPPSLPVGTLGLADSLHDIDLLAGVWGTKSWVRRRGKGPSVMPPLIFENAQATPPSTRVFKLRQRGVFLDEGTEPLVGARHKAMLVLNALRQATAENEGDGTGRQPWAWDKLDKLLAPAERAPGSNENRKATWQRWVSRTRKDISEQSGDPTLGGRVVQSKGSSYFLGDDIVVIDQRMQAVAPE